MSQSSRHIANVLAHTRIKAMSNAVSSCSDEGGESSLHNSHDQSSSSSIDTDADESDHEIINNNTKQLTKSRRLLKTRKTSFSSINNNNNNNHTPPVSRTNIRKDDQQQRSSSNDDDNNELNSINDEINFNNRRLKCFSLKKRDHIITTTTTDDDTTKHYRYHPLDNLEMNRKIFPSESTGSSPIPTISAQINHQIPTRKTNRFQVKSIRKSQQQQILLANAAAAKSSNDDDGSISNSRTKFPLKPSLIERKHTNTPTTDGENSTTNTDNIVNGAVSVLKTVENDGGIGHHRVRFHVTQHKKHESAAEEEKLPAPITTTPTPPPPSSAASAQGEVSLKNSFLTENFFN
jgi:hypothetical protein